MDEKDLLFNFMDNLQSWAEQELRRRGVQDLSTAMQLEKGLKKNEVTYLVALKEDPIDPMGDPMPAEVKKVVDEFKDFMPPELP